MKILAIGISLIIANVVAFLGQAYMLRGLFESAGPAVFALVCISQIIVILSVAALIDTRRTQQFL